MLWHQSGINLKGEPFVQLILDGKIIAQMSTTEARDHAMAVLQSAEAAEQDAFFMHMLKERVKLPLDVIAEILKEFRRFREAAGKKGPASDPREFIDPTKR